MQNMLTNELENFINYEKRISKKKLIKKLFISLKKDDK